MRQKQTHLIRYINGVDITSKELNWRFIKMINNKNGIESVPVRWACGRKRRIGEIGVFGVVESLKNITCFYCKRTKQYKNLEEKN